MKQLLPGGIMGNAGTKKPTPKELDEVYETLRSIDKEDWEVDSEKLGKHIKESLEGATGTDKEVGLTYRIACRVAHGSTKEEFVDFMQNGELPPTKLSSEEMQALRGGFFSFGLGGLFKGIKGIKSVFKGSKGKGLGGIVKKLLKG